MKARTATARFACLLVVCSASGAAGQTLPSGPVVLDDGRITVGGDVSASLGSADPGFFNYTDYEHSALRHAAARHHGGLQGRRPHLVARRDTHARMSTRSSPYALYVRIRPWTNAQLRHPGRARAADLRRVRAPHLRHRQPADRLSARLPVPDVAPARRAAGQRRRAAAHARPRLAVEFSDRQRRRRIAACRWSARSAGTPGVQVHARQRHGRRDRRRSRPARCRIRWFTTTTAASSSRGASRCTRRPASSPARRAARGPFVTNTAARGAVGDGHDGEFTQTAWGADVEYSRDYYLVRVETIVSHWRLPLVRAPWLDESAPERRHVGRRPLQDSARPLRGGAHRSSRVQRSHRHRRAPTRGTRRSRGSRSAAAIRCSATCCSSSRTSTISRDGGRVPHVQPRSPRSSCSGSDDAHAARSDRSCCAARSCAVHARRTRAHAARAGLDPRPRRAAPRRAAGRAAADVADLGTPGRATCPIACESVVYLESAPRGAFEQTEGGHAVMDQRNETFVPHVLAITTGTTVDFPNCDRIYHNVFSLSKTQAVRSRPLRGRPLEVGPLRSAGHRPRVLRHPLAHERVHPRVQPSVLRDDRQRGPLPHRQRAAGHLQRRRLERRRRRRSRGRSPCPTAAPPSWTSRFDDDASPRCASRIFLASALLAVLSIGAAIYLVNVRVTREAERTLQREIVATGALVDQLRATRTRDVHARWRG